MEKNLLDSRPKPLIIVLVLIIITIIYFWRQDVEYKKCYEIAPKTSHGQVVFNQYPQPISERCLLILKR